MVAARGVVVVPLPAVGPPHCGITCLGPVSWHRLLQDLPCPAFSSDCFDLWANSDPLLGWTVPYFLTTSHSSLSWIFLF